MGVTLCLIGMMGVSFQKLGHSRMVPALRRARATGGERRDILWIEGQFQFVRVSEKLYEIQIIQTHKSFFEN